MTDAKEADSVPALDIDTKLLHFTRAVWTCNICLNIVRNPFKFASCGEALHIYCQECIGHRAKCIRAGCHGGWPLVPVLDPDSDLITLSELEKRNAQEVTQSASAMWRGREYDLSHMLATIAPQKDKLDQVQQLLNKNIAQAASMKEVETERLEEEKLQREIALLEYRKLELQVKAGNAFQQVLEAERKKLESEHKEAVFDKWEQFDSIDMVTEQLKIRYAALRELLNKRSERRSAKNKEIQKAVNTDLLAVENARLALATVIGEQEENRGMVDLFETIQNDFNMPEIRLSTLQFTHFHCLTEKLRLPDCHVRVLRLDHANLFDPHTRMLAEALRSAPSLEYLSLNDNCFGEEGACALLDTLSRSPYSVTLRSISVNDNRGKLPAEFQKLLVQQLLLVNSIKEAFPQPDLNDAAYRQLHERVVQSRCALLIKIDLVLGFIIDEDAQ